MARKLDLSALPVRTGTIYPPPYAELVTGRTSQRLSEAGGLSQFGVNLVILAPGAMSSMRHWHEEEDEFVMVTLGSCVMITNDGEEVLVAGDCVAFPAGTGDAHHFVNRSEAEARFIVVGHRAERERVHYPDQGLRVDLEHGRATFRHEDGSLL